MISQFTALFGEEDINIDNMVNKSRGDYAYTLFDLAKPISDELMKKIEAVEGVLKTRRIK